MKKYIIYCSIVAVSYTHLTKTTRGNGRVSATSWMCCGKLSETDEDGIRTSYGYNSAHQLVETIRSEISDGNTVITPETITTYTRDAVEAIAVEMELVEPVFDVR